MNGDKLIRWTAVAAVLAVAGVAAWISYRHAIEVVTGHGEAGAVGHWYPVVIDGLIVAASMVLLDAARHREPPPRLAWLLLAAGIGATLAVNVLAGTAAGPLGAVIAAWPALAFVGCYELLMMLVRAAARRAPETGVPAAVPVPQPEPEPATEPPSADAEFDRLLKWLISDGNAVPDVPELYREAAATFAADLTAGHLPGIRAIREGLRIGQDKATQVQAYLRTLARTQ